jgi:hypothetical protein
MAELARLIAQAGTSDGWRSRRAAARAAYEAGHPPTLVAKQMVRALCRMA